MISDISSEPDASGRYEVVFAEDGAIRKLVATGIIPLCNLVAGRKVTYLIVTCFLIFERSTGNIKL